MFGDGIAISDNFAAVNKLKKAVQNGTALSVYLFKLTCASKEAEQVFKLWRLAARSQPPR